ncbi:MAG: septum site-determining protein MinC [Thioalkalivibrionaceae bacterium]
MDEVLSTGSDAQSDQTRVNMATESISGQPVLETLTFKGRMLMMAVVALPEVPLERLERSLTEKVAEAPEWFSSVPVSIDLANWQRVDARLVTALRDLLRRCGLRVLAVVDSDVVRLAPDAASWTLPVVMLTNTAGSQAHAEKRVPAQASSVSKGGADQALAKSPRHQDESERTPSASTPDTGPSRGSESSSASPSLVLYQHVRSGQQVYARGGDLIIFGSVSDGAEILADGHIHVHGCLRGRALAGVQGDTSAILYARQFEPQLISIAGHYRTAEDLDRDRGLDRLVRLDGEALHVTSLEHG